MIKIKPKIACVKCEHTVDEFLEEWKENEEKIPTQKDYDKWIKHQLFAILCSGGICEKDIELI